MKTLATVVTLVLGAAASFAFTVSSDFEGGSCRVLKLDEKSHTVEMMPAGDPQRGWPCWWCFRVDGCEPGVPVTVLLRGSDVPMPRDEKHLPLAATWAMPEAAFISADGKTWEKTGRGEKLGAVMKYVHTPGTASFFIAWGPAFTPSKAALVVKELAAAHPGFAKAEELCRSLEGRSVPMLHVLEGAAIAGSPRPVVWFEARQHAWESGSSWVAQGCMEWLVGSDPEAAWLRQHAEIFCVPIMDVDNTATGNGGKDALPQDHNRDWSDMPHWNEVAAAQKRVKEFIREDRMAVFLDLHNPAPADKKAFFYALPAALLPTEKVTARDRFIAMAAERIGKVYPMLMKPKEDGPAYHPLWRQMSGTWVTMNGNAGTVGICLETAWNIPECSTDNYRKVGAALAATASTFLQSRSTP